VRWLVIASATAILGVAGARQWQKAGCMPASGPSQVSAPSHGRVAREFEIVLALEWIPIFGAAFVLSRRRRPELILPVIALIVGLHFFPLARIFGATLYYFTGAAIVITSLTAIAARDPLPKQVTASFGCGLVLWTTAALLLV
jgi:Family of unknown function (DUF7010)